MTEKIKQTTTNVKTMYRGSLIVGKFLAELVYGASAVAVLVMAGAYVHQTVKPKPLAVLAGFAVILMALVGLRVIGKYVKAKGDSYEH